MKQITDAVALKEIRKAATAQYGCLIPDGDIVVTLEAPWTRETFLGTLKRQGTIKKWRQIKEAEVSESNLRKYEVIIDSEHVR